jgi:anti-sigma factor RsiW
MSCERIESLLPAYAERELPPDEMQEVEQHLAGCGACRETLADFDVLEQALLRRKEEVPAVGVMYANVLSGLGFSRARRISNALLSLPGILSISFLLIGAILWIHRDWTEALFSRDLQLIQPLSRASEWLTNGIVQASGGDVWVLLTAYLGLTVIILLVTGKIVMNFVRAE